MSDAGVASRSAAAESAAFPYPCQVISLDRTPERLAAFLAQNAGCGLPFEKFSAADGNLIAEEEAIRRGLIKPRTEWRTKATVGVAQSLDWMMNVFYRRLAAYIFVAPLALPHNDWEASTVDQRRRP